MTATTAPEARQELTPFKIQPITFAETVRELEEIAAGCMAITVKGLDDTAGIEVAHKSRMQLVKLRGNIDRQRKSMKADALEYGRKVDDAAKQLAAIIAPAEKHLEEQESIVKREKERLAREAEERRQAMIRSRLAALQECGKAYMADDVAGLSQEDFDSLLGAELEEKRQRDEQAAREEAERERIAEKQRVEQDRLDKERAELERKQQAAEERMKRMQARSGMLVDLGYPTGLTADRLADLEPTVWEHLLEKARQAKQGRDNAAEEERAKLERQRQEQEAEAQRILDSKRRIADDRYALLCQCACPGVTYRVDDLLEMDQAAFDELLAKQQAEKQKYDERIAAEAKREAEETARREAEEAKAREGAEEAERKRVEALRPDREKLLGVADAVGAIDLPDVSEDATDARDEIDELLHKTEAHVRRIANSLVAEPVSKSQERRVAAQKAG